MPYYEEFARIHYLYDARKIAKTQLYEAQKAYDECCSALAKEKEKLKHVQRN